MKMWLTRDLDENLILHFDKPMWIEKHEIWVSNSDAVVLDFKEFPEVTFENGPQEVEINLVKTINSIKCYNCKEIVKYTDDDVMRGFYVVCPDCGEHLVIL